jgi:GntR family transcriptional regulator
MPTPAKDPARPSKISKAVRELRAMIARQFAQGGKLPSEHELASRLSIDRNTVHRALELLSEEGLVTQKQGEGTFAHGRVIGVNSRLDEFVELTELIKNSGFTMEKRLLSITTEEASRDMAEKLGIVECSPILVSKEVLFADGKPVIYIEDFIPRNLIEEPFSEAELADSYISFLKRRCHQQVSFSLLEIIPRVCDGPIREILQLPMNQAILESNCVSFNYSDQPIAASRVFYREPFVRHHIFVRWRDG